VNKKISFSFAIIVILLIGGFLTFLFVVSIEKNNKNNKKNDSTQIANPASEYCVNNEGKTQIRTNADGSQTGYCVFKNGNECEEWAYFRKECGKIDISDWNTFKNIKYGYQIKLSADWVVDDKNIDDIIFLVVNKDYSASFEISVTSVKEEYNIDELIKKSLPNEVKEGRNINKEEIMVDGEKGYAISDCGKFECVTQKWAVVKNGKFYFMRSKGAMMREFDQVFATFKFIK
jgi:putative hemolysin